jgi:small subunit ribosomal protein S20
MPHTASAKKRQRQNVVRRERNRAAKATLRTLERNVRQAADDGKVDQAEELFRTVAKKLDQAAAKRLIHPNKAARDKSRLQQLIKGKKRG